MLPQDWQLQPEEQDAAGGVQHPAACACDLEIFPSPEKNLTALKTKETSTNRTNKDIFLTFGKTIYFNNIIVFLSRKKVIHR